MESGYSDTMTPRERRTAVSLAAVYAVRMLGLFMILPVFSLYAKELSGVTPFLIGVAIGVYGLTQASMQLPLGMLSDRLGRKPVIIAGLLVFVLGSVVAASSTSIYGVILGRALQGLGAVASALMALAADLTREEHRSKVMATIGASIGVAFSVAMVGGPMLDRWIGVSGIFWLTALLGLAAIVIVARFVPRPHSARVHRDAQPVRADLGAVLRDFQLLRLDLGIFVLHLVLTSNFVVLPLMLRDSAMLEPKDHWMLYLPVLVAAFAVMIPFIIVAERRRRIKPIFIGAVAVLALAELSFTLERHSLAGLVVSLFVFFAAFNLLEATLPSLVAKFAPPDRKGTAMGVYSTSQFLGIFCGGALGGGVYGWLGVEAVFAAGGLLVGVWLLAASTMKRPRYLSSYLLNVGRMDAAAASRLVVDLTRIQGVAEAVVVGEEGVAYLKVERHALDADALREFSVSAA